jgi:magnesium-transporting ATPase (P-type)
MRTVTKKSGVEVPSSKAETGKAPDIASAPVPDTLAALRVDPETGLTRAEVDARRKEHGYNEVTGHKAHPLRKFRAKFCGVSAWMLELIMILSAVRQIPTLMTTKGDTGNESKQSRICDSC